MDIPTCVHCGKPMKSFGGGLYVCEPCQTISFPEGAAQELGIIGMINMLNKIFSGNEPDSAANECDGDCAHCSEKDSPMEILKKSDMLWRKLSPEVLKRRPTMGDVRTLGTKTAERLDATLNRLNTEDGSIIIKRANDWFDMLRTLYAIHSTIRGSGRPTSDVLEALMTASVIFAAHSES